MTLETVPGSDGELDRWRAVKQYSRSSADQEIPMCYELRPAAVLMRTCAYLLLEIGDTKRQVRLTVSFLILCLPGSLELCSPSQKGNLKTVTERE